MWPLSERDLPDDWAPAPSAGNDLEFIGCEWRNVKT